MQLEQDTAKTITEDALAAIPIPMDNANAIYRMFLDHNRAGMALIEIITPPVLRTPEIASLAFSKIISILRSAKVSTATLHLGAVRCDVNVSLGLGGPRTEIKNLNSVRAVRESCAYEIYTQKRAFQKNKPLQSCTKSWDGNQTKVLRVKGGDQDYRFAFDQ